MPAIWSRKGMEGSSDLYEPCVECKKKRTICIRVRRPEAKDFGHAAITVHEPLEGGGEKVTSYGNWPSKTWFNRGNDLRKNDAGDDPNKDPRWQKKDVKCKEMSEEDEKKLKEAVNKKQLYDYTNNNCARWAGSTWNGVTGENLNYGAQSNYAYNSPTTLGDSMNPP